MNNVINLVILMLIGEINERHEAEYSKGRVPTVRQNTPKDVPSKWRFPPFMGRQRTPLSWNFTGLKFCCSQFMMQQWRKHHVYRRLFKYCFVYPRDCWIRSRLLLFLCERLSGLRASLIYQMVRCRRYASSPSPSD